MRPKGTTGQYIQKQGNELISLSNSLIVMRIMKLIIFVTNIALVLSRPIGQEAGEKHEALTGNDDIEGYDLGLDDKRIFQAEKPKSQIRFGYGLKFGYKGAVLHGLNRYNLMVGLEIPDIRLAQFFRPQIPDQEFL